MGTARRNRIWNQIYILLEKNNIKLDDDSLTNLIKELQDQHIYQGKNIEDLVNEFISNYAKTNDKIVETIKETKELDKESILLENANIKPLSKETKQEMEAELQAELDKKAFGEKMKAARAAKKAKG